MTTDDLARACSAFEQEHGVEAFLDALSDIMTRRMAEQGLGLTFDEGSGADILATHRTGSIRPDRLSVAR